MNIRRFVVPVIFLSIISVIFAFISMSKECYDKETKLNVFMLHMVTEEMPEDESLNTLYITDSMLRNYCEYFKDKYKIVSLEDGYDIIKNNKATDNPNLLAFTFDDGYDNNYFLAYPILKEFNIKANINIIAKYTDENYPGYLTWEQVKEMADSGLITIGSHTYDSHYYIDDFDGESRPVLSALLPNETKEQRKNRIFSDLKLADNMISKVIGKEVEVLAYPYGVAPFDLMDEINQFFGYEIQLLVRPGVNKTKEMFGKLNRFTVDGTKSPEELEKVMKRYNGLNFMSAKK